MRILVTGAKGYIGGRLSRDLSESSDLEPVLLIRPGSAVPEALRECQVFEADITDPAELEPVEDLGVEALVHLAAVNEIVSERDPPAALEVNVGGVLNLLEVLAPSLRHAVYFSTFHVYGANGRGRVSEEMPIAPVHPYAVTHAMAELYFGMYSRCFGFASSVLRVSNGYGAPLSPEVDRWTLVVNDLCRQAVNEGRLTLRTHGLQVRDFVHLSDISEAVELVLRARPDGHRVFNLGGQRSFTILEVARVVARQYEELFETSLPIERADPPVGYEEQELEFVGAGLRELGFVPATDLPDGIRETLRFCSHHFGRPDPNVR